MRLEASCGLSGQEAERWAASHLLREIYDAAPSERVRIDDDLQIVRKNGFWFVLLYNRVGEQVGVLGLAAPSDEMEITNEESSALRRLLKQAAQSLEDRQLQQGVFAALATIMPQLDTAQRWRGTMQYRGASPTEIGINGDANHPSDFSKNG